MITFNDIISTIISGELQRILLPLKIFLLIISLGFLIFLIFFLIKTKWLKLRILYRLTEFFTLKIYGAKKTRRVWKEIKKMVERDNDRLYKKAIIMADNQLGVLLERLVILYQKRNFEERLDWLAEATFPNIEELKKAHEIRKKIEENSNYQLTSKKAREILENYEKAFKELEII